MNFIVNYIFVNIAYRDRNENRASLPSVRQLFTVDKHFTY